jgi:hypothetical protein
LLASRAVGEVGDGHYPVSGGGGRAADRRAHTGAGALLRALAVSEQDHQAHVTADKRQRGINR